MTSAYPIAIAVFEQGEVTALIDPENVEITISVKSHTLGGRQRLQGTHTVPCAECYLVFEASAGFLHALFFAAHMLMHAAFQDLTRPFQRLPVLTLRNLAHAGRTAKAHLVLQAGAASIRKSMITAIS